MSKFKHVPVGLGAMAYGWTLYVSYWSRPKLVWQQINQLEWNVHLNPKRELQDQLEQWKAWRRMSFIDQLLTGPPKRAKVQFT